MPLCARQPRYAAGGGGGPAVQWAHTVGSCTAALGSQSKWVGSATTTALSEPPMCLPACLPPHRALGGERCCATGGGNMTTRTRTRVRVRVRVGVMAPAPPRPRPSRARRLRAAESPRARACATSGTASSSPSPPSGSSWHTQYREWRAGGRCSPARCCCRPCPPTRGLRWGPTPARVSRWPGRAPSSLTPTSRLQVLRPGTAGRE